MMVKLKSKVNGAIETVKALYNNYGANREKAYWEKMPPELRSNLSTSCHLNKNATFGYKRGFLKEGACCNYYDASGNEISLNPGKTFFEVVSDSKTVTLE